ncbi:MAG: type IX secretion system sortase PorU [Bacteroidales bacterium]
MKFENKHFSLLIIISLICFGAFYAYPQNSNSEIKLKWEKPYINSEGESSFISSLVMENAVYADSIPEVPVFVYRVKNEVPHFSREFIVSDIKTGPLSPQEISLLDSIGFAESDFTYHSGLETTRGESWSVFHIVPLRKVDGNYEKLLSFNLKSDYAFDQNIKYEALHEYPEASVLANGNWFRFCTDEDGIYSLTYQDLDNLGINLSQIEKSSIQIFGNGGGMLPEANDQLRYTDLQENAIWVSGNNSGTFTQNDYILFYGQSPNRWTYQPDDDIFTHEVHYYSNETCYFITYGQNQGKRVTTRPISSESQTHSVTSFYDYDYHQQDIQNLIGSGKIWFGELFDVTLSRSFSFDFPNIMNQQNAHIRFYLAARSGAASSFTAEAGGQSNSFSVSPVSMSSSTGAFARHTIGNMQVLPPSEQFDINLTYNRTATGGRGWLNYIAVNAKRELIMSDDQMFFRNPSVRGVDKIARYEIRNMIQGSFVWDVSEPLNVVSQQIDLSGNTASFKVDGKNDFQEFVVFSPGNYLKPSLKGQVNNQNLHGSVVHDLIIVVPDLLRQEAERLAEFRQNNDDLTVKIVSPQEIYNEFSSGVPDISAIRNYMKMYYDRAAETGNYPRYLLLFGNGTYDNKNILGFGGNFIPTFQTISSLNSTNSYITDDFFGLFDDSEGFDAQGAIDLGIGRFPVRTVDEARFVVNKILRYDQRIEGLEPGTDDPRFAGMVSNYADWRNVIAIVADDGDGNIHFNQSQQIANFMDGNHPVYNLEKIYLDAYEQTTMAGGSRYPAVNKAIKSRVNQGALLINYIGHGGVRGLAHERILTFDDILSWGNFYNLPVFMTATCEFSSFDQPDANELSAGVRVFLKPDGGASALFTTTRLAWAQSNFNLNDAFMRNAFKLMDNDQMPRLGDLIRIAKVESSSTPNLKNFVLLGDPSMQMAYPRYKAITTEYPDTMKALQEVTIKGEIQVSDGSKASDYNGIIYPTIYDKEATFTTLANDSDSRVDDFSVQNRILYRGKASVADGEFSFKFVVPRDITYNSGFGKISYYFDDGEDIDGNGYFDEFIISGTADDYISDNQGPSISLYLNNTNFESGNKTGPDPILIAHLNDENGINTTGQIGHDIVAILNDDSFNPIVLNNFYQSNIDDFRSGRVIYPFFNLEEGNYTLTLRAWDVHNNVSTASIDFLVASAPGLNISELKNYPNPFSDITYFTFSHNKPATELSVRLEVYSFSGQLVKTMEQQVYASGFNVPPIEWDGTDNGGTLLGSGIYLFRVIVNNEKEESVMKSEKLMILR